MEQKRTMVKMNNGWSGKVITGMRGENDMKGREDQDDKNHYFTIVMEEECEKKEMIT